MLNSPCLFAVFCLAALGVGLGRARFPAESATGQVQKKSTAEGSGLSAPLPAGAIARLGRPHLHQNNLGSLSLTFLTDGRTVISTGPTRKIAFWEAETGKLIRSFDAEQFLAISPDGKRMASTADWKRKKIRLLDLSGKEGIGEVAAPEFQSAFRFSPDSRYLAVGGGTQNRTGPDDPPLRLYEVATQKEVARFAVRLSLGSLTFSPDGKKIATTHRYQGLSPLLQVWDIASGKELHRFEQESAPFILNSIAISPDGKMLAGVGNSIRLWGFDTGKERWRIYFGDAKIGNFDIDGGASIAFSPNGKTIAVGTVRGKVSTIYLLEAASGRERARFETQSQCVFSVAFSPSGLMLGSVGEDCAPLIWDVTGQILAAKNPPAALSAKELDACWVDLGGEEPVKIGVVDMRIKDAAKIWQAICALTIRPKQAVPFLQKRLPTKWELEPKRLARLQREIEDEDFATRERATKELAEIGFAAIPFLKKLQASKVGPDAQQRIRSLLGEARKGGLLTEELRCAHAIEILEYIGTSEAKELLRAQSKGNPSSPITQDAKLALDRLTKRPSPP